MASKGEGKGGNEDWRNFVETEVLGILLKCSVFDMLEQLLKEQDSPQTFTLELTFDFKVEVVVRKSSVPR